jgi:NDP-sugar pyrophosphorylase family protein
MSAWGDDIAPRAMILAAGLGTRLRPRTDSVPKPLTDVVGYPLIAYGLRLLRENGIGDVVVNVHHLGGELMAALGDGARYGVRIHYSVERTLLGSGGGIRHAAPILVKLLGERPREISPIVVMNSDVICEVPIRDVVRTHLETGARVTLVLRDDPEAARYGLFGIDRGGRIRRFLGTGDGSPTLQEYMFASVHVISPDVLDEMPADRAFGSMSDFYPALFRAGSRFSGYVYDGRWFTADTESDLVRTCAALERQGLPAFMDRLSCNGTARDAR